MCFPTEIDGSYGFKNRYLFARSGNQNSLGIVNLLIVVKHRAIIHFFGTNKFMTHMANNAFAGQTDHLRCNRINVNNDARFRIDNDNPGFNGA